MLDRIRVLPALIISAVLLFGVKIGDVWETAGTLQFATAFAKENSDDGEKTKTGNNAADKMATKTAAATKDEKSIAAKSKEKSVVKELSIDSLTRAEIKVLQSLAKRRHEIEKREKNLRMQSAILSATEKRINSKISKLKELETRIQALLKKHDAEAEKRIKSLVKMYESMKPKDAARILENLEMEILLGVAERMKEAKMAAVLAKMDPKKARLVTVKLANRRELPKTGG